jgi:nickel/cobalt exporter
MGKDEKSKLRTLLSYWVEHNREHGEEFREWADRAVEMGEAEIAGDIRAAVQHMDRVTEILSGTLKKLEAK